MNGGTMNEPHIITACTGLYTVYIQCGIEAMCEYLLDFPVATAVTNSITTIYGRRTYKVLSRADFKELILNDPSCPLTQEDKVYLAALQL